MAAESFVYSVAQVRTLLAGSASIGDALGAWVLLGRPVEESGGGWSFRTASVESDLVQTASGQKLLLRDDDVVMPIKKKAGDAVLRTTVLVGRSDSNDLVIPHASVSKLHARLDLSVPSQVTVSDAGSSNGSTVDAATLGADEKRVVKSGATVSFGKCAFCVLSTDELVRLLKSRKY